ncbi:MAG: PucR family transcriptional regulator [Ignavibacteriales bacterium]
MRVRDLLHLEGLKEHLALVAGAAGLDRTISNVTVMEAPDLPELLSGHELILTTLYSMRDDAALRMRLVMRLAEKHAAGIIVKVGRFVDSVPPEMIAQAEEYGLPIFAAPSQTLFREVIYKVVGVLLRESSEGDAKHALEPHISQRLWKRLLNNESLHNFCADLAKDLPHECCIVSASGAILAASPAFTQGSRDMVRQVPGSRGSDAYPLRFGRLLIYRCEVLSQTLAYLAVEADGALTELQDSLVRQTATAVAYSLLQNQRAQKPVSPAVTDAFEEILFRSLDSESIKERLKTFGYELGAYAHVSVLVFELCDAPQHMWVTRLLGLINEYLPQSLSCVRSTELITVTSSRHRQLLSLGKRKKFEACLREMSGPGKVLGMGFGLPVDDPTRLHSSYILAKRAIDVGRRFKPEQLVHFFQDYVLEALILNARHTSEGRVLISMVLDPVREYDRCHDSFLVPTIEHVLASGGIEASAAEMHVHPNTIRYRLRKIEELTGLDPLSPQGSLYLRTALVLAKGSQV